MLLRLPLINALFIALFIFLVFIPKLFAETLQNQTILLLKFNNGNPAPYGMPSTEVIIQGHKIPLLLDTGATRSSLVLSKNVLKHIHYHFTGKKNCFHAMDGVNCEPEIKIADIQLGSFKIKDVNATIMPHLWDSHHNVGFINSAASENGIIGYELVSKFNLLLDYPHARAILINPNHHFTKTLEHSWTAIPFHGKTLTPLILNGKPMLFGWDTGAIPSIIKTSAAQNIPQFPCPSHAPYANKPCKAVITKTLKTVSGNKTLPNTWFSLRNIPAQAPFDGLFGGNFFMKNQVYFDFQHHIIYVHSV